MAVGDTCFSWLSHTSINTTFLSKPPTTFLTCFCRVERQKYARKTVCFNQGSNSQPPGHESDTPRWGARQNDSLVMIQNKTVDSLEFRDLRLHGLQSDLELVYKASCIIYGYHIFSFSYNVFRGILSGSLKVWILWYSVNQTNILQINPFILSVEFYLWPETKPEI